jgi:hypothetical protein
MSYAGVLLAIFLALRIFGQSHSDLPLVNKSSFWNKYTKSAKAGFLSGAREIVHDAWKRFPDTCYRVNGDCEVTVIPIRYANDIRNNGDLSFGGFMTKV